MISTMASAHSGGWMGRKSTEQTCNLPTVPFQKARGPSVVALLVRERRLRVSIHREVDGGKWYVAQQARPRPLVQPEQAELADHAERADLRTARNLARHL